MPSCQATLPLHQSPCPQSPVPRACGGSLFARALHPEVSRGALSCLQQPCIQRCLICKSLGQGAPDRLRHERDTDTKQTTKESHQMALNFKSRRAHEKRERGQRGQREKEAKEGMQRQPCYALSTLLQYEAVRRRTGAGACSSEGEATACRPKSAAVHTDICLGCSKSTVCRVFLNCRAACKNSQNPQFFEFSGRMRKQWEWDIESSMNDGVCA